MDVSALRLSAVVIGILVILLGLFRLRKYNSNRLDVIFVLLSGVFLSSIGLYPGLLNLPGEFLFVSKFPGFRVLIVLALFTAALCMLYFRERVKSIKRDIQFDKLFRHVAINSAKYKSHLPDSRSIAVLIPAFNEENNIIHVIPDLPKEIEGYEVFTIVINDGSLDSTSTISKELGAIVINHPFNRGGGAALRTGYDMATLLGTDIVVTMDADGQHQPDQIASLVKPIINQNFDIVIGSRFLGKREPDSRIRVVGIRMFNFLIRVLLGKKITDCTSGFRAFRLSSIRSLNLLQDQYHTAELIIEAMKRNANVVEVPITISKRISGSSKKGTNLVYGFGFLRSVLKAWFR